MEKQIAVSSCLAEDCPCHLTTCAVWGNCVECVRIHRTNQEHVPECFHPMLRDIAARLAQIVELPLAQTPK